MHRQALLVSLSLSPASTAAKNDKHWAFLDEIDAPQWADLKAEEALAKAGTIGDDPWFYRSHSHHEVPLIEIASGHAADVKDLRSSVRTPNLERKKNRGSSKAKLAFDGAATLTKPNDNAKEHQSPRACYNDTFGADFPRITSPVHCKSPENLHSTRRFISSDDYVVGKNGPGVLGSFNVRVNMFESQFANEKMSTAADMPASCASPSAGPITEDEDKSSQTSLPWQDAFLSKLKDTSRLRKSLGSALRVKIDDSADDPNDTTRAETRPKSRLRQSVQLEAAVLPVLSDCERDTRKETVYLRNEDGLSIPNCQPGRISSGDANTGTGLARKLGVNSSVQAFDDIRKMRKSWGSSLRVKVSEDSPVEDSSSEHDIPPVSGEKGDCGSFQPIGTVADTPSILDAKTGSEEKKLPGVDLPEVVRTSDFRAHSFANISESLDSVKELQVCSPGIVAVPSSAMNLYRRSVSFDHTPGRGTDSKASTLSRSNLVQQKNGSRASPVSRLNGPAEKVDKFSRLSKGGKENTSLHPLAKSTKLSPEPLVGLLKKSRQSVTRMSMPSLTFAAHARAAMGATGGTILKPSGNSVVETNRADSRRAAASAVKKNAGGLDNGFRKKTDVTVSNAPAKMVTRQSILRSSMPVFSAAAAAKQMSKPTFETGAAAIRLGGKTSTKIANREADLAALLAEHNRKFRPKPTYEPRLHSVKDIREWEARTGLLFYNLLPVERERANQEISAAKQTQKFKPK